ncbi:hypothetical protein L3X38_045361 [Prunus dulcis]|uniref:CCHC-type domain-containing protein n=1 Tax=Prunus dulcis TaxID=3755 RepID=A0AAD4V085_PRUDU|nr:hypothetical protein L3X38_045361 [Prunus dulcis]
MDRAAGSVAHPPYFDGHNYGAWKAKMKSLLWSLDERVWYTVVHGFSDPAKKIGKGDEEITVLKSREEWTTAEATHSTNNQKGLNAIFTAVSSDQFEYISSCDTSKEAWDILQVTHEGTDTVKGAKLQMHTLQFETIMMDENETFSEFYAKLCVIVNACSSLGEKIPEDRVVKKILRSLPQRFSPKITAIEEIRDLNTMKVRELIGSLQTYEMKHLAPKKNKSVALKVVDKEDGINSKVKHGDYTDGYGHISSECANTQKKQNGKAKALNVTWSDSDSESESEENTIALITTVSLDKAQQNNGNDEEPNIGYVLEKYDDLLAASQKLNQHNKELAKKVAVLELENSRIARTLQSSAAEPESIGEVLEIELKSSKERIIALTIGAKKIDKMISMGRSNGDKRGLGFDSINKSSAVSVTKFVKPSLSTGMSTSQTTWRFIPTCHYCGALGHIRPKCKLLQQISVSQKPTKEGQVRIQHKIAYLVKEVEPSSEDTDLETHEPVGGTGTDFEDCNQHFNPVTRRPGAKQVQKDHSPSDVIGNVNDKMRTRQQIPIHFVLGSSTTTSFADPELVEFEAMDLDAQLDRLEKLGATPSKAKSRAMDEVVERMRIWQSTELDLDKNKEAVDQLMKDLDLLHSENMTPWVILERSLHRTSLTYSHCITTNYNLCIK